MFVVRRYAGCRYRQAVAGRKRNPGAERWEVNSYVMVSFTFRHELIAFYERRGYRRTGQLSEFSGESGPWIPKVRGLKME